MSNDALGLFAIVLGLIGLLIKNKAVERRLYIYKKLGNIKDLNDLEKTKDYLRKIFILIPIVVILLGMWLILK